MAKSKNSSEEVKTTSQKRKTATGKKQNVTKKRIVSKEKSSVLTNIKELFGKHKIIFGVLSVIILAVIFTLLYLNASLNFAAIVIGDDTYSKADMNMSLYNLKHSYFGKDASEIPDATLDEQLTTVNMTVSEYLKSQAVLELKYQTVIKKMAADNNISLTNSDLKKVESEKKNVINGLGGYGKFKRFLRKNGINEKAYDRYLKANKLYSKVLDSLYSKGKANYFNEEELNSATDDYYKEYYKINQIVLATVDPSTMKKLSDTVINQKELLIEKILSEAREGKDFLELVKKYGEESTSDSLYFKSGEIVEAVETAVKSLGDNEISDVIKTDYTFTIVKRLPLDDKKLEEYLSSKIKEKFNSNITKLSEDYKVIYENAYKKIK